MSGMVVVVGDPIGPSVKGGEVLGRIDIFLRVKSDEEGIKKGTLLHANAKITTFFNSFLFRRRRSRRNRNLELKVRMVSY